MNLSFWLSIVFTQTLNTTFLMRQFPSRQTIKYRHKKNSVYNFIMFLFLVTKSWDKYPSQSVSRSIDQFFLQVYSGAGCGNCVPYRLELQQSPAKLSKFQIFYPLTQLHQDLIWYYLLPRDVPLSSIFQTKHHIKNANIHSKFPHLIDVSVWSVVHSFHAPPYEM